MKRRSFLKKFALTSTGLVLTDIAIASSNHWNKKREKLIILHTNDTHSNIEAFPDNHSKYPGMGGISKRYALIQKIRSVDLTKSKVQMLEQR